MVVEQKITLFRKPCRDQCFAVVDNLRIHNSPFSFNKAACPTLLYRPVLNIVTERSVKANPFQSELCVTVAQKISCDSILKKPS